MDRLGAPAIALSAVLWGTSFPANQVGLERMAPDVFVAARFGVAALVALLVASRVVWGALKRWEIWALGALNAAAFYLQYVGQQSAPAGAAGLLVNANVAVVALVAWVALGERPTARLWGALALALGGAALIAYEPGGALQLGHAIVFLSGALFSLYIVGGRWAILKGFTPAAIGFSTYVVTALLLSPVMVLRPLPTDATSWGLVAYTALVCTVAAYGLWLIGLRTVGATASAVILLIEIFVAALLGAWLLDEAFPPRKTFGGLAIVAAVLVLSMRAGPALRVQRERARTSKSPARDDDHGR